MEFNQFDHNRYVSHPPNHHRDIHRHHVPQAPPFHLPPPPPPLYPSLPPAPPPPPPSLHHTSFTFLNSSPRVSSGRVHDTYPMNRPDPLPYHPSSSYNDNYNCESDYKKFGGYEFIDGYRDGNFNVKQSQRSSWNGKHDDVANYDTYGYSFRKEEFRNENRENLKYECRYGNVLENERFLNGTRDNWRSAVDLEHNGTDFVLDRRRRERERERISVRERDEREEEGEENFHTPKKKSVLLRIGKPNAVRNSRSYEKNLSSSRGKAKAKEKEKDHVVFPKFRIEDEREGSQVDLDVSFKSNGLVAKTIVTDNVSPAKCFTPRRRKGRKGNAFNSAPAKLVEHSVRLSSIIHVPDSPFRSEKTPVKVENNIGSGTVSVAKSSADSSSGETLRVENIMVSGSVSGTKIADTRALNISVQDTVSDKSHKRSGGCESPSYLTRKKKKVAAVPSHASNLELKKGSEVITLDNSTNTPLSPNQGVMHMDEKINSVIIEHDDIFSLPSPDVLNVSKMDAVPQTIASDMDNIASNSGRSILLETTTNSSLHLLDSLLPQENKLDKDTSIPCGSTKMYVPLLDNVGTESQNVYTVSGIARKNDVAEEPYKNEKHLSLENELCNGSSEGILAGCSYNEDFKVSFSEFGFRSTTVSNIDLIDAGTKQSVTIENNNLLQTDIEEACLDAADIAVGGHGNMELSKADANKFDECTVNKHSSYCSPSSPPRSKFAITIIEGDKIVSCPVDDMSNQISLSGTTMHVNALVRDCPNAEVPTAENREVYSEMDYSPNVKRKRYTEKIQSELSGERTCDIHAKVVSPVLDEDDVIKCSPKEVLVENEDSFGAGNLHASSRNVKAGDISVHGSIPNEIFLEVGVVRTGNNIDLDGAPPIKKLKVFYNDEKTPSGGGSALTPNKPLNNFEEELKEVVNAELINTNNALVPSQDTHTTIEALKPIKGDLTLTRKKPTSAVPRVFTSPSPIHLSNSKRVNPANHNAKSRSWHRPGTLIASVPVSKTFAPSVSASRISPRKAGKVQGSSYVRKGNSLVRKASTVSEIPYSSYTSTAYRLNPPGKDDIRKNSGSGNKRGTNGSASWLRTKDGDENRKGSRSESIRIIANTETHLINGGLVATSEGPKTPPLPQINKSKDRTAIYAGDCIPSPLAVTPSDSCSEASANPLQQTSNVDITNILEDDLKFSGMSAYRTGMNSDCGNERLLDNGKLGEKITYVKRKSNQLIATRNVSEMSNQDVDKIQVLPSDSYYKRKSNQLIRASTENHAIPREVPNSTVNSEGKRISSGASGGSLSKRHFNKVWRLGNTHSSKKFGSSLRQKTGLFPWKRAACWQNSMHNTPYTSTNSSLSSISRKLLFSRKRDTIYTKSRRGFSLRISKLLSVGGSSLKWSKSIEKNSKRANEEATLAVAAVQKKKRDQKNAPCVVPGTKSRNNFSRERIFRIGSVRYKMDPTRRTLQRISDVESSCSPTSNSEKIVKKSYVPRRLVIGNDEYVRIGNGNQLIRDPKKRTRALASEKVRWSLHTARLRLARKSKYCQFFTRFGKCNKDDGKCPYIHDHSKIAVCTKYLSGSCTSVNCKLTHKVIPERMQDCSYYQQGLCSNHSCPYRHVNVNANASICEGFLKGYCDDGNECRKKHTYACPKYEETGICPQGSKCKLHHPKTRSKGIKRKSSRGQKNSHGRYFGSRSVDTIGSRIAVSEKLHLKKSTDMFNLEGKFVDYISIDISDEEAGETVDPSMEQIAMCASDVQVADLDEEIKPVCVMHKLQTTEPSPINDSLGESNASYILE